MTTLIRLPDCPFDRPWGLGSGSGPTPICQRENFINFGLQNALRDTQNGLYSYFSCFFQNHTTGNFWVSKFSCYQLFCSLCYEKLKKNNKRWYAFKISNLNCRTQNFKEASKRHWYVIYIQITIVLFITSIWKCRCNNSSRRERTILSVKYLWLIKVLLIRRNFT